MWVADRGDPMEAMGKGKIITSCWGPMYLHFMKRLLQKTGKSVK